jgi:sacsin
MALDKTNFNGHVFCCLPLPNELCNQTGLPVHVNGYFALSQSRHHIKWETDEQQGKKLDDLSILWNKTLITEALPLAYKTLVEYMISNASQLANDSQTVTDVYNCLPISKKTALRWKLLEQELYRQLTTVKFLFCLQETRWISLTEACFATFLGIPGDMENVKMAVITCLHSVGKHYVDIPVEVFKAMKGCFPDVKDLSPSLLSQYLLLNQGYIELQPSVKIGVLNYLFSDSKDYGKVNGLQLLPLESNRWVKFDKDEESIYSCLPEVVRLLSGMEDRIISTTYQQIIQRHVDTLCGNGKVYWFKIS